MLPVIRDWLDGLRESTAASRRTVGESPAAGDDPAAIAAERAILAAHLAIWLDEIPHLLEARRAFARDTGGQAEPDAAIVITTSAGGVAVTAEILGRDEPLAAAIRDRAVIVTEPEYRRWCMAHPDERHLLHVNHWSWIKTRVPPQRDVEFARHPLRPGERYWLHRVGTAGAGRSDGRSAHLWRFDGRYASLLEAFVEETRVSPPNR